MTGFSCILARFKYALLGVLAVIAVGLFTSEASAGSCPRPCWIELQCCCITPCPVKDAMATQKFEEILQTIKEQNKLYGVKMPGMDSASSLKTPIDPKKAASQGINVLQQAVRNVLRGPKMDRGIDVTVPVFEPHFAELEIKGGEMPPVTADEPGAKLATIEAKSKQIHDTMWSEKLLSGPETEKLRGLRLGGARISNVDALAYVQMKKQEIAQSAQKADELSARLDEAMTASDEWRLNAEAKALVTADMQALQELMSYVIEGAASRRISEDRTYTVAPRSSSNAGVEPHQGNGTDASYRFAQARSSCEVATRRAVSEHNELSFVNSLKAYQPSLQATIDEHEARKSHAWNENQAMLTILGRLYENPAQAWQRLEAELASRDKTSYFEQRRYSSALAAANAIVPDLFAQTARTRFGERKKTANCTKQKQEQNACLPYSGPAPGGNWLKPVSDINAYYAQGDRQYDAYNRIGGVNTTALGIKAMPLPALPGQKTMGINSEMDSGYEQALADRQKALEHNWQLSIDQAMVLVQYRQEAMKRKLYWDAMRRGDDADFGPGLSEDLRTELASKSPTCFVGPLQMNAANYSTYRNWFDVSPACGWRTWSGGALQGELIGHEFLGGTDSAMWAIKNEIVDYEKSHPKGRAGVEEWANGAAGFCATAKGLAAAAGREDTLPELGIFEQAIGYVKSDKSNLKTVDLP